MTHSPRPPPRPSCFWQELLLGKTRPFLSSRELERLYIYIFYTFTLGVISPVFGQIKFHTFTLVRYFCNFFLYIHPLRLTPLRPLYDPSTLLLRYGLYAFCHISSKFPIRHHSPHQHLQISLLSSRGRSWLFSYSPRQGSVPKNVNSHFPSTPEV